MSICTSQTYLFRKWYVIDAHIFQIHQSNFILAGKSFLFHIYLSYIFCYTLALQVLFNRQKFIAFNVPSIGSWYAKINHSWCWWGSLGPFFSIFFLNSTLQDASLFLSTYIFSCRVTMMEDPLWNLPWIHIKNLEPKLLLSIPFRMPFTGMVIIMTPCPRSSLISL